ncbi:unnamed protein product, partial [Staurois parvus]
IGSSDWTAGIGSPGIRHWIVWLDSGHRVTRYDSIGPWVTRASGHLARQRAPRHLARQGFRLSRGFRLNHGRQVHRFGYWQDGIGWKEFSLFSGFNYWSTASKRRSANEWSSWRQRRAGGWNRGGAVATEGFFTGLKAG